MCTLCSRVGTEINRMITIDTELVKVTFSKVKLQRFHLYSIVKIEREVCKRSFILLCQNSSH